jgi:hypothetical protein
MEVPGNKQEAAAAKILGTLQVKIAKPQQLSAFEEFLTFLKNTI